MNSKSAAILLSRQNLRPSLSDIWVQRLLEATKYIKSKDLVLLSSVSTPNWEIITASAVIYDTRLIILAPIGSGQSTDEVEQQVVDEFRLNRTIHKFQFIELIKVSKITENEFKLRDKQLVKSADIIVPVCVRPGGYLEQLLSNAKRSGKLIKRDYSTSHIPSKFKLSYSIDTNLLSGAIKRITDNYLIHWTRGFNSNWPTEKKIEFYEAILNSKNYPRTAFASLINILETKTIIATSKNMPGKVKTVSFSGLAPADAIKLMKWRARFRQMSFEPYGIAIEGQTAQQLGIHPVLYYDPEITAISSDSKTWLTQSIGKITDWRNEKEFRHLGDLLLTKVPPDKLIVITHKKSEADEISQTFGFKTAWFID